MDNGGEGDGAAGVGGFVDPDDPVGGENEEAGSENGEGRVLLGLEVDGGEEAALHLAGLEDGAAGGREGDRRDPVRSHRRDGGDLAGDWAGLGRPSSGR